MYILIRYKKCHVNPVINTNSKSLVLPEGFLLLIQQNTNFIRPGWPDYIIAEHDNNYVHAQKFKLKYCPYYFCADVRTNVFKFICRSMRLGVVLETMLISNVYIWLHVITVYDRVKYPLIYASSHNQYVRCFSLM